MKITLSSVSGEINHDLLATLFPPALGALLKSYFDDDRWEGAIFDIAMLFDAAEFHVDVKVFRPRLSFVDEAGNLVSGAAEFSHLHEYSAIDAEDLEPDENFSIELT